MKTDFQSEWLKENKIDEKHWHTRDELCQKCFPIFSAIFSYSPLQNLFIYKGRSADTVIFPPVVEKNKRCVNWNQLTLKITWTKSLSAISETVQFHEDLENVLEAFGPVWVCLFDTIIHCDTPRNRLGWVSTPRSDERKKRTEAFGFHISCPNFAISPLFLLCHLVRKNTEGPHTRCMWQLNSLYHYNLQIQDWPFRDFPMRFSQNFFENGHLPQQAEKFPSCTRTRFPLHVIQAPVSVHSAQPFLHSANETKQSKLKRWTRINIYPLTLQYY